MTPARATSVVVGTALLAVLVRGGPVAWVVAAALIPALWGATLGARAPRAVWDAGLVVGVLASPLPCLWGAPLDAAVTVTLVALLLHQRLSPSGEDGQRASIAISTLLLVACAAHTPDATVGLAWLVWLLATPIAASVGGRGRAHVQLALATAALAVPVFWLLPRPATHEVSWTTQVAPGDVDAQRDDASVVATVRFPGPARPMVLRSSGLTVFDGVRWGVDDTRHDPPWLATGDGVTLRVHHAALGGVALVPPGVVSVGDPSLWQDGAEGWHTRVEGPVDLTVVAMPDAPIGPESLDASATARALALPELDPRITALARKVTEGASDPIARVEAISAEVSTRRYAQGAPQAADLLAAFLFDDAGGDCELYASAVATMLRVVGVPARVATGFADGEVDGDTLRFRREGAHAWAEAHLDGVGWVPVDATAPASDSPVTQTPPASPEVPAPAPPPEWSKAARPPVGAPPVASAWHDPVDALWRRWVLDWDRARQAEALAALTSLMGALGAALSAVAAVVGFVGVLRWLVSRRDALVTPPRAGVAGAWDQAVRAMGRAGWVAPDGLPPSDTASWFAAELGESAAPLVRLAWLHVEVAFGGAEEAPRLDEARSLAGQVAQLVATLGRGTGDDLGPIPKIAPRPPTRPV